MPSKRQPARQRRASENRAKRDALAARSAHAAEPKVTAKASSGSRDRGRSGGGAARTAAGAAGFDAPLMEFLGFGKPRSRGAVGARATALAVLFAVAAFVAMPFIPVSVDDRGEMLPTAQPGGGYKGLYLQARELLTGHEVVTKSTSALDANGAGVFIFALVPLLVVVGTFIYFRRTGRSLPLTIGMLVTAALVMLFGATLFLPSMIALAVASFQVRRLELPARQAERAARMAERDQASQDDEDEDEYEDDDEEYDEEDLEYEDEDLEDEDLEDEYEDEDVEDVEDEELSDEEPEADPKPAKS